jgi:hypothetical protein
VTKGALKVLDLDQLQTDLAYQRDVKAKHKKIVAEFNEEALGIPVVGERADGTLWIVDGLQRITALRTLGRLRVRAEVFASRGSEHEAEVFKLINLNRTKLSPQEEFKALLTSHDEAAWRIKAACEGKGFTIMTTTGKSGSLEKSAMQLTCINTLRNVEQNWGVEPLEFALDVIKAAWPGDPLGVYHYMVGGLAIFFIRHEKIVDLPRLVVRLGTTTPQRMLYTALQMSVGTGGRNSQIADIVAKFYRKRTSGREANKPTK